MRSYLKKLEIYYLDSSAISFVLRLWGKKLASLRFITAFHYENNAPAHVLTKEVS
jgi:hypothetical protein